MSSSTAPSTSSMLRCAAPAKINLFLHVTGRRADGYHLLQSVFQLLDWCDWLDFEVLPDAQIIHRNPLPGVPAETDLCVRAATLLQQQMQAAGQTVQGAALRIEKNLPMGGGLGGGSSDAATTLLVLNHLWQANLSRQQLMQLGLRLGADVPFFLFGQNAFAEGIGEDLQPVFCRPSWFVIVAPGVMVPTPLIFSEKSLTRDTDTVKIADFSSHQEISEFGKNDLQAVAEKLFPPIADAIKWLSQFGDARMTGSGSCVFCRVADEAQANAILGQVPENWKAWKANSLQQHPLAQLLD